MPKFTDISGQKFNKLTVVKYAGKYKLGGSQWLCICDCGTEIIIRAQAIKSGNTPSCGCLSKPHNITNKKFSRLTAIKFSSKKGRQHYWLFLCDCGNKVTAKKNHVIAGKIRSCGCLKVEETIKRFTTHGLTGIPEHNIWFGMKDRCNNPNHHARKNYGGKGIKVCERWMDFANFYSDMGPRPSPKHSIDRVNNDGDYEPGNCKWATMKEQNAPGRRRKAIRRQNALSPQA